MEVLAQLAQCDNTQDAFLDELWDVAKGLATAASQQPNELEEARQAKMDLKKGWQMAEMAQKWTYISSLRHLSGKLSGQPGSVARRLLP
ncbi:MAG: hypothetical protein AB2556_24750 [Candidatus Thiodiazotropha sp.]